jgi:hypothetical protein
VQAVLGVKSLPLNEGALPQGVDTWAAYNDLDRVAKVMRPYFESLT